jgi:DNA-directed RNA polymerase beta subunit
MPHARQPLDAAPLPWHRAVISAYFEEKGLVRQQLDSFDEFINTSLQEIVDDNNLLTITPQRQHLPGLQVEEDEEETREHQARRPPAVHTSRLRALLDTHAQPRTRTHARTYAATHARTQPHTDTHTRVHAHAHTQPHTPTRTRARTRLSAQVRFHQIYVSKPTFVEADGETVGMFPKEARLRNLTYASQLYADIDMRVVAKRGAAARGAGEGGDADEEEVVEEELQYDKVFLGEVREAAREWERWCGAVGVGVGG